MSSTIPLLSPPKFQLLQIKKPIKKEARKLKQNQSAPISISNQPQASNYSNFVTRFRTFEYSWMDYFFEIWNYLQGIIMRYYLSMLADQRFGREQNPLWVDPFVNTMVAITYQVTQRFSWSINYLFWAFNPKVEDLWSFGRDKISSQFYFDYKIEKNFPVFVKLFYMNQPEIVQFKEMDLKEIYSFQHFKQDAADLLELPLNKFKPKQQPQATSYFKSDGAISYKIFESQKIVEMYIYQDPVFRKKYPTYRVALRYDQNWKEIRAQILDIVTFKKLVQKQEDPNEVQETIKTKREDNQQLEQEKIQKSEQKTEDVNIDNLDQCTIQQPLDLQRLKETAASIICEFGEVVRIDIFQDHLVTQSYVKSKINFENLVPQSMEAKFSQNGAFDENLHEYLASFGNVTQILEVGHKYNRSGECTQTDVIYNRRYNKEPPTTSTRRSSMRRDSQSKFYKMQYGQTMQKDETQVQIIYDYFRPDNFSVRINHEVAYLERILVNIPEFRLTFKSDFDFANPAHVQLNQQVSKVIASNQKSEKENAYTIQQIEANENFLKEAIKLSVQCPSLNIYDENFMLNLNSLFLQKRIVREREEQNFVVKYNFAPMKASLAPQWRYILWKWWKQSKIPLIVAREMEYNYLKQKQRQYFQLYWILKEIGLHRLAKTYVKNRRRELSLMLYLPDEASCRTNFAYTVQDLYSLSSGGDCPQKFLYDSKFKRPTTMYTGNKFQLIPESRLLKAVCLDSGTWPIAPGGVSVCRRDLVDHLQTIRWTGVSETLEERRNFGDFQLQRNVDKIHYHTIFSVNLGFPSDSMDIDITTAQKNIWKRQRTSSEAVKQHFVPLLISILQGCFDEQRNNSYYLAEYRSVFLKMHIYFQVYDWKLTWENKHTKNAFLVTSSDCIKLLEERGVQHIREYPILGYMEEFMSLFIKLLEGINMDLLRASEGQQVIHASHHGIQNINTVVIKELRPYIGVVVWDHGILYRERAYALIESNMNLFAQIGFLGLTRLIARMVYDIADCITPCTGVQNIRWEQWQAGVKYQTDPSNVPSNLQKISTVYNGIDLNRFKIQRQKEVDFPLAVMLSHVARVKDIHNAVLAANTIVQDFGIKDYKLWVYGSLDNDPSYVVETKSLIESLQMGDNVILKGKANPADVLCQGWVFVNSSCTEGLPLAPGEAGLCGIPVCLTDVGGSREVAGNLCLTCPPSQPYSLARIQLQLLAMSDGMMSKVPPQILAEVSQEVEPLPREDFDIPIEDLKKKDKLNERINNPFIKRCRQIIGDSFQDYIKSKFAVTKYWREHEQVLRAHAYQY